MNVGELIEKLKRIKDKTVEVVFAYDYKDRPRTMVTDDVSEVEEGRVQHSDYHQQDRVVTDDNVDDDGDVRDVIILS